MWFDVELTPEDMEFCSAWMTNWTYLRACLSDEKMFPEDKVLKLIKYEVDYGGPRMHLLSRLVGKYNTLRKHREWEELVKYAGG